MATIEIDGKTVEAENGKMIIEVADEMGIYIPRFCYHKKLSVAANCRMCLVEVDNNRKTVPACATPINNGMKVFTKTPAVVQSQQAVMDFLLINHPLDCPICDQGGECELQDLSMGFGHDDSSYVESKLAVVDDNLGPLIDTHMTRCIQCTRCVRFGEEVAGLRELGSLGRGENSHIGTYVKESMISEVSGNIIDLCPVGALTARPSAFIARAWEMTQYPSIAPHDCLGSNVYLHVRRNQLIRVVPREQDAINEVWLSDRDRFSYVGLKSPSRAGQPMIKRQGQWEVVDWQTALQFAADGISRVLKQHGPEQWAAFASSSATLEEYYLLQKLMRDLGVHNLDHRLQQTDFRDQALQTTMPQNSLVYAALESQATILLFGCNIHREVPLAGLKVRKAYTNGARIYALNVVDYDYRFTVSDKIIVSPDELPLQLARVLASVISDPRELPQEVQCLLIGLEPDVTTLEIAKALQLPDAAIVTGAVAENHPHAALLRTLIALLSQHTGARVVRLTVGANAAGAWLAGMVPHRGVAGTSLPSVGLDIQASIERKLKGYLLMGVEPGFDCANPSLARQSMLAAECVVVLSAFQTEAIQEYADVILPIAPYAETSGTYINVDHCWQTVKGASMPYGEARPAWKVLRVLGNLLHCDGFDFTDTDSVLCEIKKHVDSKDAPDPTLFYPETLPVVRNRLVRVGEWPLYRADAIVRHASPLQECAAAETACIRVHPETALHFHLTEQATVSQGDIEITLPLNCDNRIPRDVVCIANAMAETVDLGHAFAAITIK